MPIIDHVIMPGEDTAPCSAESVAPRSEAGPGAVPVPDRPAEGHTEARDRDGRGRFAAGNKANPAGKAERVDLNLTDVSDLQLIADDALRGVLSGKVSPEKASAIAVLLQVKADLMKVESLDERLAEVEDTLRTHRML